MLQGIWPCWLKADALVTRHGTQAAAHTYHTYIHIITDVAADKLWTHVVGEIPVL